MAISNFKSKDKLKFNPEELDRKGRINHFEFCDDNEEEIPCLCERQFITPEDVIDDDVDLEAVVDERICSKKTKCVILAKMPEWREKPSLDIAADEPYFIGAATFTKKKVKVRRRVIKIKKEDPQDDCVILMLANPLRFGMRRSHWAR